MMRHSWWRISNVVKIYQSMLYQSVYVVAVFLFDSGATLLTKWDQVLRENPTSFSLWNQYITLRETNFASFTVQCCLDIFEECIDAVTSIPHRDIVKLERNLIYVLNRLCSFLSQSGTPSLLLILLSLLIYFGVQVIPRRLLLSINA